VSQEPFRIVATPRYKRDAKKYLKQNKALLSIAKEMIAVLRRDPYNTSKTHNIVKLTSPSQGEGQYRIRSGDYRIRYDIIQRDVVLYSFKHRKDAY
jgi:mRNA-degrading endonuclease RelE of RelBE toxin-antitoxin system